MMDITPEVIDESLVGCKGTMHIKDFLSIHGGSFLLLWEEFGCWLVQIIFLCTILNSW